MDRDLGSSGLSGEKEKIRASRHRSLRRLAPLIKRGYSRKPMDVAALSRILNGKRIMTLDEANQIAILLDLPLAEVVRRAGYRI